VPSQWTVLEIRTVVSNLNLKRQLALLFRRRSYRRMQRQRCKVIGACVAYKSHT